MGDIREGCGPECQPNRLADGAVSQVGPQGVAGVTVSLCRCRSSPNADQQTCACCDNRDSTLWGQQTPVTHIITHLVGRSN